MPTTAFAASESSEMSGADMVDSNGIEYLFNPELNQYIPIRHVEAEVAEITKRNGRDVEFENLFETKRANDYLLAKNTTQTRTVTEAPIPGGVGYGAFYTSDFQSDFTTGTLLYYNIICPSSAGGDVDNFLYLTSTNRAAKGVEAFISYYAQENPYFKVYDWAKPESDRWQVTMSYSDLSDYLLTKTIGGASRQCVSVQNKTVQVSSTQWANYVWLYNSETETYDQIYTYTYTATLSDQRDSHYGSWGPIVETFQDTYESNTNIVGFYHTNLKSKTTAYSNSTWGDWELLTSDVSTIRNDNLGFSVVFSDPNYTFGVH